MTPVTEGDCLKPDSTAPQGAPARRWAMLAILSLSLVLSMSSWFSATAVLAQLRLAWALSDTLAAWLTIAVQLGFVIGAVASSVLNLSDLLPPRRLMLAGALGAALANAGLLWSATPAVAIALRMLTGVFLACVYPPALKLIATWFVRGRGLALGVLVGALTLGSALPHLLNALGGLRWQLVLQATSVATLAGAALVATLVREGPYPFPRAPFNPGRVGQVLRNRGIWLASLGYFGHMWELYAMWAWYLTFARQALARQQLSDPATAAMLTFAVIAMGGIGCVAGGLLGDRWGRTLTTALMLTVSGACAALSGLVFDGPLWLFVAVSLVWGFSVVADSAQFSAMVTELGDPMYIGTALTLQLGLGFVLTVVTIWLLPLAAAALSSWQWVFLILLPGPVLGVLAMLALRRLPEAARIAGGRR